MKGRTKITINRETLKALLEGHIKENLVGDFTLHEFTVHRNSSVELVVSPTVAEKEREPELPLGEERTGISQE